MPFFRYRARNRDNYVVTDILEAIDKGDAVRKLKQNDMVPIEVIEIKLSLLRKGKDINITSGVSKKDIVFFLSQFYNLLHGGLSIPECIKIIIDQTNNKYLKKYLIEILQDIRNGSSLYTAMGRQRKVFPKLIVEMVKVGESIGKLDDVINDLYLYYKKQVKIQSDITSAMIYPIFLLVATITATIFLLVKVVPEIKGVFDSNNQKLPLITQFVLNSSAFFQHNLLYVLIGVVLVGLFLILVNKYPEGKYFYSNLALRIPIFGRINRKSNLVRIARTYSTLLDNSVNAIEALEITRNILKNQIYIEILNKGLNNLSNGIPLSKAFDKHWGVDPVFKSMISIGEETATLGEMLGSIAEYYDNELESQIEKLKRLMEPIMILILVGIVGTLVLAIMMPMFSMLQNGFSQ